MTKIQFFFHPDQMKFRPKYEWALGNRIKHPETTKRAEIIFNALKHSGMFEHKIPKKIPLKAIKETHSFSLLTLYNSATLLPEDKAFYPSVFPKNPDIKPDPTNLFYAGYFCFDSGTPLDKYTKEASFWSAACSYYAAESILKEGNNLVYSLSRPPGHHAYSNGYGGYCYLNNSAIAAKLLKKHGKVAILDIDFHHGNGTQKIFYSSNQVLTISIHGDPIHYFPFYTGFTNEIGKGEGEGFNLNVILPAKCDIETYIKTLHEKVFPVIENFAPDFLIIAAGFDTYALDPIGDFSILTEHYQLLGKEIKSKIKKPILVVQEGGYYSKDLGLNVISFLKGLSDE